MRQVKSRKRARAHTKSKSVCTRLQGASASLPGDDETEYSILIQTGYDWIQTDSSGKLVATSFDWIMLFTCDHTSARGLLAEPNWLRPAETGCVDNWGHHSWLNIQKLCKQKKITNNKQYFLLQKPVPGRAGGKTVNVTNIPFEYCTSNMVHVITTPPHPTPSILPYFQQFQHQIHKCSPAWFKVHSYFHRCTSANNGQQKLILFQHAQWCRVTLVDAHFFKYLCTGSKPCFDNFEMKLVYN